jgi:hypothetical protein
VTPEEKKAALQTSKIIRASRKARGWTQAHAAQIIGVSQSALSKIEAGTLIPSVHQWFEFCQHAGIPADSHILGHLDRLEPVTFQERVSTQDFKIKEIYRVNTGSSARSLAPLLKWSEQKLGTEKLNQLLKSMGVDPDYFIDFSHPISLRFFTDFIQALKTEGAYRKTDLPKITQFVSDLKTHGLIGSSYLQSASPESVLKTAFSKSYLYELNFDYQIEEHSSKKTVFSAKPKDHLKDSRQLHLDLGRDYLCDYRNHYFKNLASLVQQKSEVKSEEHSCFYKGADRCVHELSYSSASL